ncbi:hypothetical protein WR30_23945 [Burkholderia contaminans FFH2055]|nr:hypothetical protein NL30_04655 [Burkholderia contaminans]KKL33621.1 hypothetical protein WR30_23945 [Burkholderia contaminans FFH2055]
MIEVGIMSVLHIFLDNTSSEIRVINNGAAQRVVTHEDLTRGAIEVATSCSPVIHLCNDPVQGIQLKSIIFTAFVNYANQTFFSVVQVFD